MKRKPDLLETVLKCLSAGTQQRTYTPDQLIIDEGDVCEAAYFILKGTVRIYRISPQGRQQTLVNLGAGQAFNTVPAFQTAGLNPSSAVAMTSVTLLILYKEDIEGAIKRCPDLALAIIHDFAERLSHLSSLAGDLALLPVRARLARFLLDEIANPQAAHWTHEEIASRIGSVREVVSRNLRGFIILGMIRKDRQQLIVVDREALEREALG